MIPMIPKSLDNIAGDNNQDGALASSFPPCNDQEGFGTK